MSFRFPGEHLINGKRFGAEILIHCDEIHPDEVIIIFKFRKEDPQMD